jgi:hypothetical protein
VPAIKHNLNCTTVLNVDQENHNNCDNVQLGTRRTDSFITDETGEAY